MNGPAGNSNSKFHITPNTGVSIGLLIVLGVGVWSIWSAVASLKSEIESVKSEVTAARKESSERFDRLETRVSNLETSKTIWTGLDMLKWCIHLKDSNQKIDPGKGLNVPEPEIRQ